MQNAQAWIQSDIKRWKKICRVNGAILNEDELWQIYFELQEHSKKKAEFNLLIALLITEYQKELDFLTEFR
ncbi:hypothetical protein CE91St36_07640 [Christensenellaceae bacterium]|nr:hypothetical protein CE91St36_07640 [Christensenellaceae bacterium]BDF60615.1 hypothetical protein CE91St37_07650 [Christensenellaceae bacterium]